MGCIWVMDHGPWVMGCIGAMGGIGAMGCIGGMDGMHH